MEKLIGGQAIADYLGISRRHFTRIKAKYEGTDLRAPVFGQLIGMPGRRYKIIWSTPELIQAWWFQLQNPDMRKNNNIEEL